MNPKTEAAIRKVYRLIMAGKDWGVVGSWDAELSEPTIKVWTYTEDCEIPLRSCFEKRQPLTGITKRINQALRTKKGKKPMAKKKNGKKGGKGC